MGAGFNTARAPANASSNFQLRAMSHPRSLQPLETAKALNELTRFPDGEQDNLCQVVEDWFADISDGNVLTDKDSENDSDSGKKQRTL